MKNILVLLIGILLISCKHKKTTVSFHQLDITYSNGWSKQFSVIIDSTGKVILAEGRSVMSFFGAHRTPVDTAVIFKSYEGFYPAQPLLNNIVCFGKRKDDKNAFVD